MKGASFLVEVFEKIFRGVLMEQEGGCNPQKLDIAKQLFIGLFSLNLNAVKGFTVPKMIEEIGKERCQAILNLTPEDVAFARALREAIHQFTIIKELMEAEGEAREVFKAIRTVHQEFEEQRKLQELLEKYEHLRKNISLN